MWRNIITCISVFIPVRMMNQSLKIKRKIWTFFYRKLWDLLYIFSRPAFLKLSVYLLKKLPSFLSNNIIYFVIVSQNVWHTTKLAILGFVSKPTLFLSFNIKIYFRKFNWQCSQTSLISLLYLLHITDAFHSNNLTLRNKKFVTLSLFCLKSVILNFFLVGLKVEGASFTGSLKRLKNP